MTARPRPSAHRTPVRPGSSFSVLQPLGIGEVRLLGTGSLGAWQELNAVATIPHCIAQLESSGVIDNFRRLIGESGAAHRGFVFADSDLHKTIEAVAWEIGRSGTTAHDAWLDEMISLIGRVQEPNGYLHTWIQGVHPEKKFAELHWTHELYVLGHWIQAGIALDRTTGRSELLERAIRFVELVERRFGPGREDGIPGHPEIETALVELYRHTGEERHLLLAHHLIDQRGRDLLPGGSLGNHYFQDHLPVREATDPIGHAVRQLYLNAGVTDLFLETGEQRLHEVMREQWDRAHERKMYLSGAFGSRHRDESFGNDFELPSDRAYAETCATIADLHWTWRMMLAGEDLRYADVIEREIHNALAASMDASGTRFFYSNPMQRRPDRFDEENAPADRQEWYSCACCPPNIARTIAQLGAYIAGVRKDEIGPALELLQFTTCELDLPTEIGEGTLRVATNYPADGTIDLSLEPGSGPGLSPDAHLALRIPGWAREGTLTTADGATRALSEAELSAGRLLLDGALVDGARLELPMPPRWTASHPRVDATRGCLALERGPIVYCVEQVDLPAGIEVDGLRIDRTAAIRTVEASTAGNSEHGSAPGSHSAPALRISARSFSGDGPLLQDAELVEPGDSAAVEVTAIPFAGWGNRGPGAMRIWIPADA